MHAFGTEVTAPKRFLDGTHRTVSPRETLERFVPRMRELGITRIANVTGLDCIGIPVCLAVRPNARNLSVAQGKGLTLEAAKASALMESIETWHAEWLRAPLRHESASVMRREANIVEPHDLPLARVGPFDDIEPILWLEGWDFVAKRPTYVPEELVNLNSVRSAPVVKRFRGSGNGLASGNHILEATVHGLTELIERDALCLWNHRVTQRTSPFYQVRLDTVTDPGCRQCLELFERADVGVVAWDIASDIDVPAYMVTIFDAPGSGGHGLFQGFGCHLDRGIALLRALTEAAQARLTNISGSRDDLSFDVLRGSRRDREVERLVRQLHETPPTRSFTSSTSAVAPTFEDDLQHLLRAVERVGVDAVAAVDLTRKDLGVPVVKVVATGLEPPRAPSESLGRIARARLERIVIAEGARS